MLQPNIVTIILGLIFLSPFILLGIYLFIRREDIRAWFHPEDYNDITMVEKDGNIRRWREKKNNELKFIFHGNPYNMYFPRNNKPSLSLSDDNKESESIEINKDKDVTVVFRCNRLASYTYTEFNEWPIDFRNINRDFSVDAKLRREMAKDELSGMVNSVSGFSDIWTNYKYILIGIFILILIWLIFRKPPQVILTPEVVKQMAGG